MKVYKIIPPEDYDEMDEYMNDHVDDTTLESIPAGSNEEVESWEENAALDKAGADGILDGKKAGNG